MTNLPRPEECIDSFRHPFQAQFLRDLLRQNGIESRISSQRGMSGTGARMAANHAVMVPGHQAEEAARILKSLAIENEDPTQADQIYVDWNTPLESCPNCGSTNLVRRESRILPLPVLRKRVRYTCPDCDWSASQPRS